jgi:hypothetical protein
MNMLIWFALLPAMRAIGRAPYAGVFSEAELKQQIVAAGFDIVTTEYHATKKNDTRPYIVAKKKMT